MNEIELENFLNVNAGKIEREDIEKYMGYYLHHSNVVATSLLNNYVRE